MASELKGAFFKGSKSLVTSCMKILLGSNETCMKQSMQEALGASGFEGCIEMFTLSHRNLSKRSKHAGSKLVQIEVGFAGSMLGESKRFPYRGHFWPTCHGL